MDHDELAAVLDELIEIMHLQTRQVEKLMSHVQQVIGRLPEDNQISAIHSGLSGLHARIKKLRGNDHRLP